MFRCFLIPLLFFLTQAYADTSTLNVKDLKNGLFCLTEMSDPESANSFLLQGNEGNTLIDAGWSDDAKIPGELSKVIDQATKVSTHFHFDHIRQWHSMQNIVLTKPQANFCKNGLCSPSRLQTIMGVTPFKFNGEIIEQSSRNSLNSRLSLIECNGHSHTDTCFLDRKTRTLFVGDLFYLGPVFYFLPGGKVELAISSVENLLKRDDWDQLALSHGECSSDRSRLAAFLEDLKQISAGKVSWVVNFDFWLPLRAYKIRSGYVVTNLIW